MITRLPRPGRSWLQALLIAGACGVASGTSVIGLKVTPAAAQCGELLAPAVPEPLAAARARVPDSQVVRGSRDIQWAWLGSPTPRYPHTALGSPVHAGSLHVLARAASGAPREVVHHLPLHRVFEDRVPRLVDLDRDGHDDIIVVESDLIRGAAVVVYGLRASTLPGGQAELAEIARSPHAGSRFAGSTRWAWPISMAMVRPTLPA
jgi:hypothetical protein